MPRPQKPRWIDRRPGMNCFIPQNCVDSLPEAVVLTLDELEALRLADREGLAQEEAAEVMNVSRATFGRIVSRGRAKTAEALTAGRPILIQGGAVEFPPAGGRGNGPGHGRRNRQGHRQSGHGRTSGEDRDERR